MTNVFIKPSGKAKGSQTIGAKNDKKSQGNSKNASTNPKSKVMAKVMKVYPNGYGAPSLQAIVSQNMAAKDGGKTIPSNVKRSKFISK